MGWIAIALMAAGCFTKGKSLVGLALWAAALVVLVLTDAWTVNVALAGAIVGLRMAAVRAA